MTTTSNGQALKQALVTAFASALSGVSVTYSPPADLPDECVYGGKISGSMSMSAFRTFGGDTTRDEEPTVEFVVRIFKEGESDTATADARAFAIGAAMESYLAANSPSVTGLLNAEVSTYDLESTLVDEGAIATLTYRISARSTLQ